MALLFASKALADTAVSAINNAMDIHPNGDVTTTWDVPRSDANGKWVIARPDDRFMAEVVVYTEGGPVWASDPGLGG